MEISLQLLNDWEVKLEPDRTTFMFAIINVDVVDEEKYDMATTCHVS